MYIIYNRYTNVYMIVYIIQMYNKMCNIYKYIYIYILNIIHK